MLFILQNDTCDPFNLNELIDELSRKQKKNLDGKGSRNLLSRRVVGEPKWRVAGSKSPSENSLKAEQGSKMVTLRPSKINFLFLVKKSNCLLCITEFYIVKIKVRDEYQKSG